MCFILNIETTSAVCSVAIAQNGNIISARELGGSLSHAENLHTFIQEALQNAGISASQLHAVAISKGPGSYTGLRIGSSAAKGLAYALNIPLLAVDTLQALSSSLAEKTAHGTLLCPMFDARRMEVYAGMYDKELNTVMPVSAVIVDEQSVLTFSKGKRTVFFGSGMPKCKELLSSISGSEFVEGIEPSSRFMAKISHRLYTEKKFENTAYFEPFYLKEFYTPAKK